MTRAEITAYNRGVADLASIASASAEMLRAKLTTAPTRFNFAIGGLEGIVEAAGALALPLPPDGSEPAAAMLPRPSTPPGGTAAAFAMLGGDQR